MKRSTKSTLAMLSVLLFSSLLVSSLTVIPSEAVDYTKVGVKVGDWAYYSGMTNMTGLPPNFEGNLTVANVDRSNVTGTLALYYTDGTLIGSQTIWGNISSGDSGPKGAAGLFWFLLVPNLAKDDMIFVNNPSFWINDTGIMVAGGRARPYAHVNVTISGNSTDLHMDQATGIGLQTNLFMWNGANHFYLRFNLTSTSLWSPPTYKVGVKEGDTAHYSYYQNTTGYTDFTNANLTITKIDRGNVTTSFVMYNSTMQNVVTPWGNISSGYGTSFPPLPWLLIAANLTEYDPIWLNGPYWINDTSTRVAGGLARVLDHTNITLSGIGADIYWDHATGIVVSLNVLAFNTHLRWNLISTSLWSPPDYTKVGVKVGDWVFFSVKTNQTGMETATSANLTIVAIDRLNVTFRVTVYDASGPILVQTNWGNLSDGTWGPPDQPPIYWWLIASNLVKYDPLYHGSSLWINETVTMVVFGESRECNHLHTNVAYLSSPVPGSMDLYWDKATGTTVKADIILNVGVVWRIQWNATSTSLWSPAPTIDQPATITYTYGTIGHSTTWHPSSNVPCNYTITKDGAKVTSANWNGQAITYSVDGLSPGTYAYVCTVNDTIGRRASSSVTVTVSAPPPTISEPADITYTSGTTGHGITWQCSSLVPKNYTITRNGTVVSSGDWDGHAISCNVDGLEAGTYIYICTVCDTIGRRVSSSVTVTVSAPAQPQPFPVELLVGGIAGIAAVIIVVVVVVLRKRGR